MALISVPHTSQALQSSGDEFVMTAFSIAMTTMILASIGAEAEAKDPIGPEPL